MPAVLLGAVLTAAAARGEIPPPAETPARMIVSGRTSTAVDIKTVKVGQDIPKTYAGVKIHNTPGFDFYVSQHYALKSNMGDDYAGQMLEIAELAYPHAVALVGREPPDPDTRMYFVCANDAQHMIEAMVSDVGMGPQGGYGGGITIFDNRSAYNYPSGTLQYHQRALVIHENLHLLNMVTTGTAGTEGMTYSFEQHVYDPARRQLTVLCFDKPTINNHTDEGLLALQKEPVPMQKAVSMLWDSGGGLGAVYTQFFLTDPDRYFKWCIWREEFYAGHVNRETNPRVMEDIYGPLEKLNADWEKWLRQRHSSFHFVDWGWEQEGNALVAYGWPWDRKFFSQTDINYAPGEKVAFDTLRMDYPAEPMPPIVGPVKRGVAVPAVGYVIDFSRGSAVWGGLGLGVQGRGLCEVVIASGTSLVIDGSDLGMGRREFPIPPQVSQAARDAGQRYGVTIRIKPGELEVRVHAGRPGEIAGMTACVAIDAAQRERLMTGHMAIIAKDGRPAVTPFIDDAREPGPDLTKPSPANRWRFAGEKELYGLYRAAWKLKERTPDSLERLRTAMVNAVDKGPAAQRAAMALYRKSLDGVLRDVRQISDQAVASSAADEIMGERGTPHGA
jgi:hypothetical protein